MQAIKEQYKGQLKTNMVSSSPFKFKDPHGSLKIVAERSSDEYKILIAMEPSNAKVVLSMYYII